MSGACGRRTGRAPTVGGSRYDDAGARISVPPLRLFAEDVGASIGRLMEPANRRRSRWADTHQSDMAQHFVPLNFTAGQGTLTVQTPSSAAIAPYGNYMLFIVDEKGVPSVSAPLNLSAAPEAPGAPTAVTATASGTTATVTWAVPAQGTSAITSYTVTPYIGETAQPSTTVSGSPPASTVTIPGLTQGATYTFRVTATNGVGSGPPSAPSNAITISSPAPPGQPTAVSATPGNGSATVTWSAPPANGSSITSYTVTPYAGTSAQTPTTVSGTPPATTATVGGLTNGTTRVTPSPSCSISAPPTTPR